MPTPFWVKKLGGHAGEMYVAAELSKRGIANSLLPENFSDDDILVGKKDGTDVCFVQVKACHPDRGHTFRLSETDEKWVTAPDNQFVVFVWLGSPKTNESPRYWIAPKREVGEICQEEVKKRREDPRKRPNPEVRLKPSDVRGREEPLPDQWREKWSLFDKYLPLDEGSD